MKCIAGLFIVFTMVLLDKNGNVPAALPEEEVEKPAPKRGQCKNCLTVCGVLTLTVLLIAVGGVFLHQKYTPFEVYVNRLVGDLNYPVLRMWRHIVLPLHRYMDFQYLSMRECLIENPWFVPGRCLLQLSYSYYLIISTLQYLTLTYFFMKSTQ